MRNGIHLRAYGFEAEVLGERGANLISFACPALEAEALRTPPTENAFQTSNPYLFGIPILFLPNRISGGRFTFEGRVYVFPINEAKTGNYLHGTLHETPMQCVMRSEEQAVFEYRATRDRPYLTFPHAFSMRVSYTLSRGGITQQIRIENQSEQNMPVALGFHTTFSLPFVSGGTADDIRLMLDADKEYLRDPKTYLPTGEVDASFDIKHPLLEGSFSPCALNISRHFSMGSQRNMVLTDMRKKISLRYSADENYGFWIVYNGGRQDLICVEPQTWVNNCPNAPFDRQETGFSYLSPGEARTYRTYLTIEKA
ncbi:MAG: aldose 1-epimerase [Eubacteriales bacterium]|nr:aldose 1-epimerase [Eubacteriales bacterium]